MQTVRTTRFQISSGLPRDFPYPAVVKPRDGQGSAHTYYIDGPDDKLLADDLPPGLLIPTVLQRSADECDRCRRSLGHDPADRVGLPAHEIVEGVFTTEAAGGRSPSGSAPGPTRSRPSGRSRGCGARSGSISCAIPEQHHHRDRDQPEANDLVCPSLSAPCHIGDRERGSDLFGEPETSDDLRGMIDPRLVLPVEFLADGRILS